MNASTNRRDFLKKAGILAGTMGVAGSSALAFPSNNNTKGNALPKWKGFNLLDFF
jgi:hypothetical protein